MTLQFADRFMNACSNVVWVLMFPETKNLPAGVKQNPACFSIAASRSLKFLLPPFGIRLGAYSMNWASMPVAPINKYSQAETRENYVSCSTPIRQRCPVYEISEPFGVNTFSDRDL